MRLIFLLLIMFSISAAKSQSIINPISGTPPQSLNADSALSEPDLTYPRLKRADASWEYAGKSAYTIKYKGKEVESGNVATNKLRLNALFPVYQNKKLTLSGGFNYTRESYSLSDVIKSSAIVHNEKLHYNDLDVVVKGTYISKLWGRPLVTSASFYTASDGIKNIKRVGGDLMALMLFQGNENNKFTLGLIVPLDPSSFLPVFPLGGYWHRFNRNLELDVLVLKKATLRRANTLGGWASIGGEFNSNSFFIKKSNYLSGNYEQRYNEINGFVSYERMAGKNILMGIKGGYHKTTEARLLKTYDSNKDYVAQTNIAPSLYVNFNVSFIIPNVKLVKKLRKAIQN